MERKDTLYFLAGEIVVGQKQQFVWGCRTSRNEVLREKRHISKRGGKWYFSMQRHSKESINHFGARAWQRFKKEEISIPPDCAKEIKEIFHLL